VPRPWSPGHAVAVALILVTGGTIALLSRVGPVAAVLRAATQQPAVAGHLVTPPPTGLAGTPTERLVPTASDASGSGSTRVPAGTQAATGSAAGVPAEAVGAMPRGLWRDRERVGVGVPEPPIDRYPVSELGFGWYHAWRVIEAPPPVDGLQVWQMVRVSENGYRPDATAISRAVRGTPGATWLIGNEPDVIWQDNTTPETYARAYHDVYHLLKSLDPSCRVAVGGIAQPSPVRLEYLERVRAAYALAYGERMPVEMWHIHNFILREERGSWGVDIPPGIETDRGRLYDVQDNDNLTAFKSQIVEFRRWMAAHAERDRPLVVSEYGIPMPIDYGFGAERVGVFLTATFDFLLMASDPEIGLPADGNRLVQHWAWFSMGDTLYPTGNLVDLETGQLTQLGHVFAGYVGRLH